MRHRFRRSEVVLRGPRNDLIIGPRSSRAVRSASRLRADYESGNEKGQRARRRRFSGGGPGQGDGTLSLIHISEPTRLALI
eukprot:9117340-Alexandrium_andersonii.AAC.1